jgi:VIT1/CCC1 family predicted Fe2+/Mn2+ transporter
MSTSTSGSNNNLDNGDVTNNVNDYGDNANDTTSTILNDMSDILSQQNSMLQQQNEQLEDKRLRNEIQLNAIEAKKNVINTRARMLQIAQENNVYKQKIIYTLIAFIFAVFIAILVMYVFYSKNK